MFVQTVFENFMHLKKNKRVKIIRNCSIFCILLFSVLSMNCGKSYPKCADSDSINLVKEIVDDNTDWDIDRIQSS